MIVRLVLPLVLVLLSAASPARAALYEDGVAGKVLLDAGWSVASSPGGPWTPVAVPHSANAGDLSPAGHAGSVAYYRTTLTQPAGRYKVRFESVSERAEVFLNGEQVGAHEGAYVPFEVDASLRDGPNELLVRVDWRREADGVPGTNSFWWNWGGILREVYLRRVDRVDLEDVWTQMAPRCATPRRTRCPADTRVRARLRNVTDAPQTVALTAQVASRAPAAATVTLPARATRTVTVLDERLPDVRLWSPATPVRYAVRVRVTIDGTPVAGWGAHAGARRFSVRDGHLHLNGRRIRVYGVAQHEESPRDTGGALSAEQRERDQRLLSGAGARVIRAHYPLHPSVLEWADRTGVLVWDEIPAFRPTAENLRDPSYRGKALTRLREMLVRDRSHPSVMAFSIGNEPIGPFPEGTLDAYVSPAVGLIERLAPGTPTAMALLGYEPPRRVLRALDLVGFNLYIGWYGRQTVAGVPKRLRQIREQWPDQATIITEYGAEANRSGPRREKGTEEFQTRFLRDSLRHFADDRHLSGAITWILRDFACVPDWAGGNPKPTPPFNHKGIVRADGTPKPSYAVQARMIRRLNERRLLRGSR